MTEEIGLQNSNEKISEKQSSNSLFYQLKTRINYRLLNIFLLMLLIISSAGAVYFYQKANTENPTEPPIIQLNERQKVEGMSDEIPGPSVYVPSPTETVLTMTPTSFQGQGESNVQVDTSVPTPTVQSIPTLTQSPSPTASGPYYLAFGPKGNPDSSFDTAKELLEVLNGQGFDAQEISRWVNSGWETHVYGYPFGDYIIKAGEGYVIKFGIEPTLPIDANFSYSSVGNLSYQISQGWTAISIPSDMVANISPTPVAEDLCTSISLQGIFATEIMNHTNFGGADSSFWTTHVCGNSASNFSVSSGKSYFIKSDNYGTWSL